MDTPRWDALRALLERLLELDRPGRVELMARTEREDPRLARELRRLLRHERRAEGFLKPPGEGEFRAGSEPGDRPG